MDTFDGSVARCHEHETFAGSDTHVDDPLRNWLVELAVERFDVPSDPLSSDSSLPSGGRDLGGGTPHQIALGNVAEVLAVSNDQRPRHLREREDTSTTGSRSRRIRDGGATSVSTSERRIR